MDVNSLILTLLTGRTRQWRSFRATDYQAHGALSLLQKTAVACGFASLKSSLRRAERKLNSFAQ